jgi:hypothetical protein
MKNILCNFPLHQVHVYIFVLTNALSDTFATADALSSSHNEASGRM